MRFRFRKAIVFAIVVLVAITGWMSQQQHGRPWFGDRSQPETDMHHFAGICEQLTIEFPPKEKYFGFFLDGGRVTWDLAETQDAFRIIVLDWDAPDKIRRAVPFLSQNVAMELHTVDGQRLIGSSTFEGFRFRRPPSLHLEDLSRIRIFYHRSACASWNCLPPLVMEYETLGEICKWGNRHANALLFTLLAVLAGFLACTSWRRKRNKENHERQAAGPAKLPSALEDSRRRRFRFSLADLLLFVSAAASVLSFTVMLGSHPVFPRGPGCEFVYHRSKPDAKSLFVEDIPQDANNRWAWNLHVPDGMKCDVMVPIYGPRLSDWHADYRRPRFSMGPGEHILRVAVAGESSRTLKVQCGRDVFTVPFDVDLSFGNMIIFTDHPWGMEAGKASMLFDYERYSQGNAGLCCNVSVYLTAASVK
jgi:hypothetical protein